MSKSRPDMPEPGTPERTALDARIARMVREEIHVVDADPGWAIEARAETARLAWLLDGMIGRIEHFGSTAVPELAAKPIIDLIAEAVDLDLVRDEAPAILEPLGYEFFWRPTGADERPFYAWFVKRDRTGERTHHIHIVGRAFPQWDSLIFRDLLRADPEVRADYADLKRRLAREHTRDRGAYTRGKSEFIRRVMERSRGAC